MDALEVVPGAEERVHRLRERVEARLGQVFAAAAMERGEVHGAPVRVGENVGRELVLQAVQRLNRALRRRFRVEVAGARLLVAAGAEGQLPGRLRGQAADAAGENLPHRAALSAQRLGQRADGHVGEGQLAVGRRILVSQTRQHLAHRGHGLVHAARAVDDASVAADEDQVGMLAHELADEALGRALAQLVVVLDGDFQNAVAVNLLNVRDAAAGDVLAQQHAQRGRLQRAGFLLRGEMRPGAVRAGGEQQQMVLPVIANGQVQFVALGLDDAVDAAVDQRGAKLVGGKAERQAVQWHGVFLRMHNLY